MKGGFLLALLGAWVVTQVIGGEALQRLGVLPLGPRPSAQADAAKATSPTSPAAAYTGAGYSSPNGRPVAT